MGNTDEATKTSYCKECNKKFTHQKSLVRHIRLKHENSPRNKPFTCTECGQNFTLNFNLKRHQKKLHNNGQGGQIITVKCSLCNENFIKSNMINHYVQQHQITIIEDRLQFEKEDDFYEWKTQIEDEERSNFVVFRSKYVNKDGSSRIVYKCHRDGMYRKQGKDLRNLKKMGSNKINAHCPAKMEVTIHDNKKVSVTYCKTHVGHEMDISRLYLKRYVRDEIAQKLALEIPFDNILDEIRDLISTNDDFKRIHLLTRKDLFNIEKQYNLNTNNKEKCNNPNVSFEAWISQMQLANNFIRFYKPKGKVLSNYPDLKENDYVLIISNDTQLEIFKKYGNNFVCIDNTHGNTKLYSYDLITLITLTDQNQSFPCAFLITNKIDVIVLTLFISIVQENLGCALKKTTYFMSDLTECYLNAWCNVTSEPPQYVLYSPWNIDRIWRKNLHKIQNKQQQVLTYKMLRTLLEEHDIVTFEIMFEQILYELNNDPQTNYFLKYFVQFKNSAPKWAYAHRNQLTCAHVNENLERIHRTLKHLYLNNAKIKRLDKAVCSIMRFLRDKFHNEDALLIKINTLNEDSLIKIHNLSQSIAKSSVKLVGGAWKIPSSCINETFEVFETNQNCKNCNVKCRNCNVCVHSFICNCPDNELKWNMCKHIHLVGEILKNDLLKNCTTNNEDDNNSCSDLVTTDNNTDLNLIDNNHTEFLISSNDNNEIVLQELTPVITEESCILFKKKHDLLRQFQIVLNEINSLEECQFIESTLTSILLSLKGTTFDTSNEESLNFVNVVVQDDHIYTVLTK